MIVVYFVMMFAIVIVDLYLSERIVWVLFRTIVVDDFSVYKPNALYAFPDPQIVGAHLLKYVHRSKVGPNKSISVLLKSVK